MSKTQKRKREWSDCYYVTVAQICERWGISRMTLYNMCERGELSVSFRTKGQVVRFLRSYIESFETNSTKKHSKLQMAV